MGGDIERMIDISQRAAVLTLKSKESVSEEVKELKWDLRSAAEQ
jgi:pseudouridine-5'-phosphate glycosidase/pseudouridine kinase